MYVGRSIDVDGIFVITRRTLVWKGAVLVAVFLCSVTDILTTVAPIGVKFFIMVHIEPEQIFSPFGGGTPGEHPNPKFWA